MSGAPGSPCRATAGPLPRHDGATTIAYECRGGIDNGALDALHAEGFGPRPTGTDWRARLHRHSLGWVCARESGESGESGEDGRLVGFVNVAWDGGPHAFLVDTVVARRHRGRGTGAALVSVAAERARAAGCEWLHVDFEDGLAPFYFGACGFRPTRAGLIAL
ncbi:GNAT family N-acetyltransferase [Streptomyces sp. TRM 70361]|uniref:GNAT family N-acetyltransferase n=1 Tax=Streptomyces sp. TRM 70361 TaxID=3116553 RepID=UPI003FCCDD80